MLKGSEIIIGRNVKQTSPKIAAKAAKMLTNPKTSKSAKSVAASALSQAAKKSRGKR
jgi:hypothetical protein